MVAAAVLAAGGTVATSSPASASLVPQAQAPFSFCNTPSGGSTIACFSGNIAFQSSTSFVMTNVVLSDKLCDNRAVYAGVWTNSGAFISFKIVNQPYVYANEEGCHISKIFPGPKSFVKPSSRIEYVKISLFAANNSSHSDIVFSGERDNPFTP